jgi:nucleoside phosphorylase
MAVKAVYDIKLDGNGDLAIVAGDFVIAESTGQHQHDLIINGPGDYKQNPTIGVAAFEFINDENLNELPAKIAQAFAADGMFVKSVELGSDGIIKSKAAFV